MAAKSPKNGQPTPKGQKIQPGEHAREMGRKGGKKRAENAERRKAMREDLQYLLSCTYTDKKGVEVTYQDAITLALVKKAMSGSVKAYETIRDMMGENPKWGSKRDYSADPAIEKVDELMARLDEESGL